MSRGVVRPWLEVWAWLIVIALGFPSAVVLEARTIPDDQDHFYLAAGAFFATVGLALVMVVRTLMLGLYGQESGFKLRGVFRTRFIPYESVEGIETVTVPGIRTGTYETPQIRYLNGRGRERRVRPWHLAGHVFGSGAGYTDQIFELWTDWSVTSKTLPTSGTSPIDRTEWKR